MARLFDVTSQLSEDSPPIPVGATMNLSKCMLRACRPMSLTIRRKASRSFSVHQVHAGRQPLPIKWNEQRDKLTWNDSPYPKLVAGQDFWVTVRNDGSEPAHFTGEVRGARLGSG